MRHNLFQNKGLIICNYADFVSNTNITLIKYASCKPLAEYNLDWYFILQIFKPQLLEKKRYKLKAKILTLLDFQRIKVTKLKLRNVGLCVGYAFKITYYMTQDFLKIFRFERKCEP